MDPTDNVFDMKKFERLCDEKVVELGYVNGSSKGSPSNATTDKQRIDKSHYWIVLAKSKGPLKRPIDPPPPFSDRLSELRPNNRIGVKRIKAIWHPRSRAVWGDSDDNHKKSDERVLDSFLSRFESLDDVQYKSAYKKGAPKDRKAKGKAGILSTSGRRVENTAIAKKMARKPATVTERMLSYNVILPPKKPSTTTDGQSAVGCLKQLQDAGLIGENEWTRTIPSPTAYASFNPDEHELVRLKVNKGTDENLNILKKALVYEQDRDVNQNSRQAIRHHLANFALCEILGPEIKWTNYSFKELRDHIAKKHNAGSIK